MTILLLVRSKALIVCALSMFSFSNTLQANPPYLDLGVGEAHICGLSTDGALTCETSQSASRVQPPSNLPAFASISLGTWHGCGITFDGGVSCWCENTFGQLDIPVFSNPVVLLDAGTYSSCAIDSAGALSCWGNDDNGLSSPAESDGPYIDVDVGSQHACALRENGSVFCWGAPGSTRVDADGTEYYPALRPPADSDFIDVEVTPYFNGAYSCGLAADGDVTCWGEDEVCRIVAGGRSCSFPAPPQLTGRSLVSVTAIENGLCGLDAIGAVHCTFSAEGEPRGFRQPGGTGYQKIVNHFSNTCVIDAAGEVECITDSFSISERPLSVTGGDRIPAAPTGLTAQIYSDTALELTWVRVGLFDEPDYTNSSTANYQVFKNGVLLADNVAGPNYFDDANPVGATAVYTVSAIDPRFNELLFSPQSEPLTVDLDSRNATDAGPGNLYQPPVRPLEPTGLRAERYSDQSLELFWDRPADVFVGYEIRRNGVFIGYTAGTSFFDEGVPGAESIQYDVIAIETDGRIGGIGSLRL